MASAISVEKFLSRNLRSTWPLRLSPRPINPSSYHRRSASRFSAGRLKQSVRLYFSFISTHLVNLSHFAHQIRAEHFQASHQPGSGFALHRLASESAIRETLGTPVFKILAKYFGIVAILDRIDLRPRFDCGSDQIHQITVAVRPIHGIRILKKRAPREDRRLAPEGCFDTYGRPKCDNGSRYGSRCWF